MTFATKSSNQNFIIFLNKIQATIIGYKSSDFFLPFLISWTLTHFLIAEFGCLASTPTFSSTIPLAWEAPPKGLAFRAVPRWAFLYCLSCHFWSHRWLRSFLAVWRPRHLPILPAPRAWAKAALIFLHEKLHGQRTLAGYSPWGHKESDTTEHTCALGISHSILWEKKFNANSAAGSVFIFPW